MRPWNRVNLALGLIAAGLLVLLVWPPHGPEQQRLTALETQRLTSIRIERADRLVLGLARGDDGWRLDYPVRASAEQRRVAQLLAVARAPVQQEFSASGSLADYGLAQPEAVLQLDDIRLAFGDRDPVQRSRYVLVGDRIRVIDDVYFNLLTLPVGHFAAD
jgi:hypothetical protein